MSGNEREPRGPKATGGGSSAATIERPASGGADPADSNAVPLTFEGYRDWAKPAPAARLVGAAPALRSRERPTKPAPPETGRGGGMLVWVAVAAVIVVAAVAAASWRGGRPDPHYLEAERIVSGYEHGKSTEQRNYLNPVYQRALAELALVDPGSASAEPAAQMKSYIEASILEFRQRQDDAEAQRVALVEQQRRKAQIERERRDFARRNPVTEYPECDE